MFFFNLRISGSRKNVFPVGWKVPSAHVKVGIVPRSKGWSIKGVQYEKFYDTRAYTYIQVYIWVKCIHIYKIQWSFILRITRKKINDIIDWKLV